MVFSFYLCTCAESLSRRKGVKYSSNAIFTVVGVRHTNTLFTVSLTSCCALLGFSWHTSHMADSSLANVECVSLTGGGRTYMYMGVVCIYTVTKQWEEFESRNDSVCV